MTQKYGADIYGNYIKCSVKPLLNLAHLAKEAGKVTFDKLKSAKEKLENFVNTEKKNDKYWQ